MAFSTSVTSYKATATFAAGGTATNQIAGTFVFKNIQITREKGKAVLSADFESDGAPTVTGFTGTTHIDGFGGGVTAAAIGLNCEFDSWSATINVDTESYSTFTSAWKQAAPYALQITGSCSGVLTE